jgi:hypothetical protein
LGYWNFEWNPVAGQFDVTPLRSAMFTCNVINFMNSKPYNLVLKNLLYQDQGAFMHFDIDIGLVHPFPGMTKYDGFDVMGVFMGNGSASYPGPEGYAVAGGNDQQLLNADGYTRWFNATEFSGAGQILPLQGYIPGIKGSPGYSPTAVLNPYKYYADWLAPSADAYSYLVTHVVGRGVFTSGSANYRHFSIRMPDSLLKFQYAILANWEPNKHHPGPPVTLDDFPPSANSEEAVTLSVVDSSTAFYDNYSTYGGDFILDISVWDWSATYDGTKVNEYVIKLYSSAWTGPYMVNMTPVVFGTYHFTFHADIPVETLDGSSLLPVWIEVGYPGKDYTSPIGIPNDAKGQLATYYKIQANVITHNPPGGTFVYGFSDSHFMEDADEKNFDNAILFTNMLNLPTEEPYASNTKVMWYEGHTSGYKEWNEFTKLVQNLGYENVYVPDSPYTPLDTTGVKMLVLATMGSIWGEYYTPAEIQAIKDFVNGGGICIILLEKKSFYAQGTQTVDSLISNLKLDFVCHADADYQIDPYTDITEDAITVDVVKLRADRGARFEVFGDGVSLVRGIYNDQIYTAICKSPMGE